MKGWDADNNGKGYVYEGWCVKGREPGTSPGLSHLLDGRKGAEVKGRDLDKSCSERL